jgi:hypothetical protein
LVESTSATDLKFIRIMDRACERPLRRPTILLEWSPEHNPVRGGGACRPCTSPGAPDVNRWSCSVQTMSVSAAQHGTPTPHGCRRHLEPLPSHQNLRAHGPISVLHALRASVQRAPRFADTCDMTGLTLVMGPIAALLGVWIGGVLSSRTQRETWQREQERRERDAIRGACGCYVAAARRFASYIKDLNTEITVVPHPGPAGPIHVLQDPTFHLELESASAEVLLVVRAAETVQSARNLRTTLFALAVARANNPDGFIGDKGLAELRVAEAAFVNAARAELGAPRLASSLYTLD